VGGLTNKQVVNLWVAIKKRLGNTALMYGIKESQHIYINSIRHFPPNCEKKIEEISY